MKKPLDLNQVVATNLKFFMGLPGCRFANANALAKEAHIAANTVRNMLDPTKRTTTLNKPVGYPNLDKVEKLATALGREVWEMLHPDIKRSLSERDMYKKIESDYLERMKTATSVEAKV